MRDRTLPAVIPVVTYGYLAEGRPSDNAKIRTSVRSTVDFAFFRPLRTLASTDQNKMLTSFRRTTKLKKRKKKKRAKHAIVAAKSYLHGASRINK